MIKRSEILEETELRLKELLLLIDRIEEKLRKIETMADSALVKAGMSHSLIVVRKVSEDKEEELKTLLD